MLVNRKTQALLDAFTQRPSGSLIIEGSEYAGKESIIENLTEKLLAKTHKNNVIIVSAGAEKSLGVEKIRELKRSLATRIGGTDIGRIAVVKRAETMTREAQNALLKLLEEPADNTVIILDVGNSHKLLETIRSRCQTIRVLPLTEEQAHMYAQSRKASEKVFKMAFLLSAGEAELFESLIAGKETEVTQQIDTAKKFLSQSVFDRLTAQKEYAKAEDLQALISGLAKVCEAALHTANAAHLQRWKTVLQMVKDCEQQLASHVPTKLLYAKLCVNL